MTQGAYRLLSRHGACDPVAFGVPGGRSAGQLRADVHALGRALPAPMPGSHIALICGDRYLFTVALLAAWQRGHAVALPPNGRPETVALVRDRPDVLLLLHDTDADTGLDLRTLGVDGGAGEQGAPLADIAADRLLVTVFTSGSSGGFTPCAKTARQLLAEVATHRETFDLRPGQDVVSTVPPHHIYGLLFSVLLPMETGAAFLRDTPLHAETIATRIAEFGAEILVTVPAHLSAFSVLQAGRLGGVRRLFCSTAPLAPSVAEAVYASHDLFVTEIFGSSETGGIAHRQRDGSAHWTPLNGVRVSADADAHLLVDSAHLHPDLPRPWRSEDRIRMHPGGVFEHLGRSDGVVKSGGKRIALAHIEACLLGLPGVLDAAAVAVPAAQGARSTEVLAAVVAPDWSVPRLREALLAWFEPSALPRRLLLCPSLPREDNGKLTRARLLALFGVDQPACTELEVLALRCEGAEQVFTLRIPEELLYFRGHFGSMPVLPGVAQLRTLVLPRVADLRPEWRVLRRVTRLKFRRIISPGDVVELRLTFVDAARQVDFAIVRAGDGCASGRLQFEVGAP